jgi:Pre-mRNA splicing Prp18-interacting factor
MRLYLIFNAHLFLISRNLRIREDTAKYLLNLDVNSAYYDPKTRSMREDPLPDMDPNEKFYSVSCNISLLNSTS